MQLLEGKNKKTTSRDLMSPDQAKNVPQKKEVKKIGTGKNDIIERADKKVVTEDGRELLK